MEITAIIKLLDLIHDHLLCPFFGEEKDTEEIEKKLDEIQETLKEIKNGKNG